MTKLPNHPFRFPSCLRGEKLSIVLAVLTLLLSACGGAAPATEPTATSAPATSTVPAAQTAPDCTVSSSVPTPGPTEASLFPPVSPDDWVHGPADADVTFIEYSDFQ